MVDTGGTIRCAVVPPVATPYREPLFEALHTEHPEIELSVIYQASAQPSWDVPEGYFATDHAYPAQHPLLAARQAGTDADPVAARTRA